MKQLYIAPACFLLLIAYAAIMRGEGGLVAPTIMVAGCLSGIPIGIYGRKKDWDKTLCTVNILIGLTAIVFVILYIAVASAFWLSFQGVISFFEMLTDMP